MKGSHSQSQAQAQSQAGRRRRCGGLLPLLVGAAFLAEIAFLGRLDMAKNAAAVESWTTSFYARSSAPARDGKAAVVVPGADADDAPPGGGEVVEEDDGDIRLCEERLEREDGVPHDRDFDKDPVLVGGAAKVSYLFSRSAPPRALPFQFGDPPPCALAFELGELLLDCSAQQDWNKCSVGCEFGFSATKTPDATFGIAPDPTVESILRSMESSQYYSENNIAVARGRGYKIVMTTSLSSDVPVGYFSWAEYDIMAPVPPKTEEALAAAFISNCGARNFRLQALEMLESLDVKIDSYGSCHRNHDGKVDKVETLKRYKFSLAFENSNEEDYVTEKFFQSLVTGAIPVVIGAPNIQEFSPGEGAILHIKELDDVPSIAKTMKHIASNQEAFNQSLRWKYDGPSDSFKALIDMAAVHSSCRLCIHVATKIHEKEERTPKFMNRPCSCSSKRGKVRPSHLSNSREDACSSNNRGFMDAVMVRCRQCQASRSDQLTMGALESAVLAKFRSLNHVPVWKDERPPSIRGGDELKVYKIYPIGLTQRQALYQFRFRDDADLDKYIKDHPCAKLEVIFV
uniref:Fucosyltransferase n=1 Tax=Oryza rufipogon TaxID=4529 RepID=A0A0E0QK73_ORYRU